MKYFKIYIDLLYILLNSVGRFFYTPSTCLVFQMAPGNVLYHHNRNLVGHFDYLHGSRMICFPSSTSEKLHYQRFFENAGDAETQGTSE